MSMPPDAGPGDQPDLAQILHKMGRKAIVAVLFALLVYAGLLLYGDLEAITAAVLRIPFHILALALLFSTGNFVVRYLRWVYYQRRLGIRIEHFENVLVLVAGFSMAVTPMRTGELLKALLLRTTHRIAISRTASIVVAERVTDLVALVLLSALGCLPFPGGVAISLAGAALAVMVMLVCAFRPFGETLLRIAERIGVVRRIVPKLRKAYEALWALTGPAPLGYGLLFGTVAWGMQCVSLYLVALPFPEVELSFEASLFIYSAPLLAGTLSMLPGGLGFTEASMTALLLNFADSAATPASAAAITLIVRLVALWWGVGLGFAALAAWQLRFGAAVAPSTESR